MTPTDRNALIKLGQSEEARVVIAKALDKARQAEDTGDFVAGDFYDPAELTLLRSVFSLRTGGARLHGFGGYEQAERRRAVYSPTSRGPDAVHYRLAVIEVRLRDRHARLTHSAVLGAVMSQGIRREKMGDIVLADGIASVIVDESIADRVALTSVGRDAVNCSVHDLSALGHYASEHESQTVTVASLRLDAVLAAAFNLSRSEAASSVEGGLVKINHVREDGVSKKLKEGDLLSLRGSGRAKIALVAGETKKGRVRLEIERPKP